MAELRTFHDAGREITGFALERKAVEEQLNHELGFEQASVLMKQHPEILAYYQERWPFVLVDEYQDTNASQYAITQMLVEKSQNLFVVGDPDQSIYSWRGADVHNILNFEKDYPDATVVLLEENYRSTT